MTKSWEPHVSPLMVSWYYHVRIRYPRSTISVEQPTRRRRSIISSYPRTEDLMLDNPKD